MKHLALILAVLLLCSLTVAPAAAYDKKIADGAHFIEISGKPLKLDREYYQIASDETVVIDGNRYYWVQIGKDRAKDLTSVWWIEWVALTLNVAVVLSCLLIIHTLIKRYRPALALTYPVKSPVKDTPLTPKQAFKMSIPYSLVFAMAYMMMFYFVGPTMITAVNHTLCSDFVDHVDADGCILLNVSKTSTTASPVLEKAGLSLSTMTHLSSAGKNIYPGVTP